MICCVAGSLIVRMSTRRSSRVSSKIKHVSRRLFTSFASVGCALCVIPAAIIASGAESAPAIAAENLTDGQSASNSQDIEGTLKDIQALVNQFYPRAKTSKTKDSLHFELKVKNEIDTFSNRPVPTPSNGGILGDLKVVSGPYKGKDKDRLPSEEISGFSTTLTLAPNLPGDCHLLSKLTFPGDCPSAFKEQFKAIL